MQLKLIKMHGSSNDILMIRRPWSELFTSETEMQSFVETVCDRSGDFGSDGIYFLDLDSGSTVGANFYNPDGSFAGMCGNGLRAVTRLVNDQRELSAGDLITINSDDSNFIGERTSSIEGVDTTRISTRSISFVAASLPIRSDKVEFIETQIAESGTDLEFTAASIPNDHIVTVSDGFDLEQFTYVGERLSVPNAALPNGANVSFVVPLNSSSSTPEFFVRTYERGAGPTPACGSGQTASRAVLSRTGITADDSAALLRNVGGPAYVELRKNEDGELFGLLDGNATYVYEADIEVGKDGSVELKGEKQLFDEDIADFEKVFQANKAAIESENIEADFDAADNGRGV